jgi:hypothetical protein
MRHDKSRERKGALVARALAGSWREPANPNLDLTSAELEEVTPLLYGSGAAALGWWRVRETELRESAAAEVWQQAYRLQALQSAIHEQKLVKAFALLRLGSIDALLAKGWAAARLYPDSALRPYGDFDLLIRPHQLAAAKDLFASPEAADCWVDLHDRFSELGERDADELFSRAVVVSLGSERIRMLGPEDHLALTF